MSAIPIGTIEAVVPNPHYPPSDDALALADVVVATVTEVPGALT